MVEDVTASSGRMFHVDTTLFEKKLCLTEIDLDKSFLSLDMKDSLPILNDLRLTPDAGPVRSWFLDKSSGILIRR